MDISSRGYSSSLTVSGKKVLIYNIEAGGDYPVHGAYFSDGENWEWIIGAWTLEGKKHKEARTDLDLVDSFVSK